MSEKDSRQEIEAAFALFDSNCDKKIDFEDLKKVAEELGEDMTDEELREMITGANKGGKDGYVEINQFVDIISSNT